MTPMHAILAATAAPVQAPKRLPRSIVVRWASQAGAARDNRREFVLDIDMARHDRATVTAWIERGAVRQCVLAPTSWRIAASCDSDLIHIDVFGDNGDGRLAAVSLKAGHACGERALYARTILLAKAGFGAGAHDPPTLTVHDSEA